VWLIRLSLRTLRTPKNSPKNSKNLSLRTFKNLRTKNLRTSKNLRPKNL
jgi:hypothetical protein